LCILIEVSGKYFWRTKHIQLNWLAKVIFVIPAQAAYFYSEGAEEYAHLLDSRLRGNDG